MGLSLISLFQGFGATSRKISEDWTGTAIQRGMPMQFERALYIACLVAAVTMNVVGWILLSFLTTFIVRVIIF
jgi:Flp pilus assembly protein TadB